MNELLRKFLEALRKRGATPSNKRVGTANAYVSTLRRCVSGLCPTDGWKAGEYDSVLKAAADTPVYRNDGMIVKQFMSKDDAVKAWKDAALLQAPNAPTPIMIMDAIFTSNRKDRDSDILEPAGAEIDPKSPLLWQHDPVHPIGRVIGVGERNAQMVSGGLAIADTPLGNDAAYLVEFEALRLSHGFRPKEYEPITEKSSAVGGGEIITGFHVLKYEMMEVSLVSIPSNVDAVITAHSRGKLTSPLGKSFGREAFASRKRFLDAGWNGRKFTRQNPRLVKTTTLKAGTPTGKKRKPVKRVKSVEDFEKALTDAMSAIVHSGDYGYGFYKAAGDAAAAVDGTTEPAADAKYDVYWVMGDADNGNSPDGTPYTTSDDIKALLSAVSGVGEVTIESEVSPPKGEGWRMVVPEVKDWTEEDSTQKVEPGGGGSGTDGGAQANDAPPASGDDGKHGKPAGKGAPKKDGQPVSGSFEHVADILGATAGQYLASQGIQIDPNEPVSIAATYPDYVIVCVGCEQGAQPTGAESYYKIGYTAAGPDGEPVFTGAPQAVELELTVAGVDDGQKPGDANAPNPADGPGAGGSGSDSIVGPPVSEPAAGDTPKGKVKRARWVPKGAGKKGRLGKKDSGLLKDAVEHLDDALSRPMPNTTKTLVHRGCMIVKEVLDSDGTDGDQPATPNGTGATPEGMNEAQRGLWSQIGKLAREGWNKNRLTIALLLDQLSASCAKADQDDVLARLTAGSK